MEEKSEAAAVYLKLRWLQQEKEQQQSKFAEIAEKREIFKPCKLLCGLGRLSLLSWLDAYSLLPFTLHSLLRTHLCCVHTGRQKLNRLLWLNCSPFYRWIQVPYLSSAFRSKVSCANWLTLWTTPHRQPHFRSSKALPEYASPKFRGKKSKKNILKN